MYVKLKGNEDDIQYILLLLNMFSPRIGFNEELFSCVHFVVSLDVNRLEQGMHLSLCMFLFCFKLLIFYSNQITFRFVGMVIKSYCYMCVLVETKLTPKLPLFLST